MANTRRPTSKTDVIVWLTGAVPAELDEIIATAKAIKAAQFPAPKPGRAPRKAKAEAGEKTV